MPVTGRPPSGEPQPPCARCGHRRIHHFIGRTVGSARRGEYREIEGRCNVFTDDPDGRGCGCTTYVPMARFEWWWTL